MSGCVQCAHQSFTMSVNKHCAIGLDWARLSINKLQEDTLGIYSRSWMMQNATSTALCMHGCRPASRSLTLGGKSITCGPGFQITSLYPTLGQASTSRAQDCVPFWNNACEGLSQKLWLPIATDSQELAQSSLNSSLQEGEQFSQSLNIHLASNVPRNLQKTSLQCSPTSPPDTMADKRIVTIKQRLYPDAEQRSAFRYMFGAHRFFYNRTKGLVDKVVLEAQAAGIATLVHAHDDGICHHRECNAAVADATAGLDHKFRYFCHDHVASHKVSQPAQILGRNKTVPHSVYNFHAVKSIVNPPKEELLLDEMWYESVPCNTRTGAIQELLSACKSTLTKRQNGDMTAEMPSFKSKRDKQQHFHVRSSGVQFQKTAKVKSHQSKKRFKKAARAAADAKRSRKKTKKGRGRQKHQLKIFPRFHVPDYSAEPKLSREEEKCLQLKQAFSRPIHVRKKGMLRLKDAQARGALCDATISRDKCGHFYLVQPIKVPARETAPVWDSQAYQDAYLDLGARTFQTLYCLDGVAAKLGDGFYNLVFPKLLRADRLMDEIQRMKNDDVRGKHAKRSLKRKERRAQALRTKVRNAVRDLHRKTMRFLCTNFKAVFIPPKFKVPLENVTQRIHSKAIRNLMTFARCEFYDKLAEYAHARGVHIIAAGEAYTTKTCTFCGELNDVGGAKVVTCQACGRRCDRDCAASRNLCMRVCVLP